MTARSKSNGHMAPTGRVIVAYCRVSTQGQSLDSQIDTVRNAGAVKIFKEQISGVRADRPQLAKLMASLRKGDVVLVTKLDRLGRSTRELLDLIHRIDEAGASFKSLGDPLFDTTSSQGRLLVTMLAAIAEFERELIREREPPTAAPPPPRNTRRRAPACWRRGR
jgi:DNA invertase Pin-like site-specific DNA recombinase